MTAPRDPVADLRRIAFLLERAHESTYRVRAFRGAAAALRGRDPDELAALAASGELRRLRGVGDVTARCVVESLAGEEPVYLRRLQAERGHACSPTPPPTCAPPCAVTATATPTPPTAARRWRRWSRPPRELGHDYLVITDHSRG